MAMTLREMVEERGACVEGLAWLGMKGARRAWKGCPRGDWMLWGLEALGYEDGEVLRRFACRCVREVWGLLEDTRSRAAVEVAERYVEGDATEDELAAAFERSLAAAWSVWHRDGGSVYWATNAAAWTTSSCAMDAASVASRRAAYASADEDEAEAFQAEILRGLISAEVVQGLFEAAVEAAEAGA